jgi:WD40 repeat protein
MLFDVPSGKLRGLLPHHDGVRAVAVSADGKTLVTSCRDHKLHVWDVADLKERLALTTKEIPRQVSIHPDGKTFLLVEPGGVAVIDVADGKPKFRLDQGANTHVYFAQHSADGRWIFTSDNHARVLVWRAEDGAARATIRRAYAYNAFAFEPRSGWMGAASGSSRRPHLLRVRLEQPDAQEKARLRALLVQLDDDTLEVREKASADFLALGFLATDELQRASESSPSVEVRMRSRWLREQIINTRFEDFAELSGPPEGLAFSPDGKRVATGCRDGAVYLWDLNDKTEVGRFPPR